MNENDFFRHGEREEGESVVSEWAEARRLYGRQAARLEGFAHENPILYHGTNITGARKILEKCTVGDMQLSFTPDYSVAKSYADAKEGRVFAIRTRDIDPRWLAYYFEMRERYPELISSTPVIQVGEPILGHEPRVIKAEVVTDNE